MSEKILVPTLGESITEATVVKWLKNKGETVETDEPIVELETDKVNLEVPSPTDGVLSEINVKDGQVVEVGTVLGSVNIGKNKEPKAENNKQNKTIQNPKEINKRGPELFDDNIIKLEKSTPSRQNEELPLVLENEIKSDYKAVKTESNKILSPAVRKMVKEKK